MRQRFASAIPATAEDLAAWHGRPGALRRLLPPWQPIAVRRLASSPFHRGASAHLRLQVGPVGFDWTAVHAPTQDGFVDINLRGPMRRWWHRHRFLPTDDASRLVDEVYWSPPRPDLSWLRGPLARAVARVFAFRHHRTRIDLERHASFATRPRLRILISGARGFVGVQLAAYLSTAGHEVVALERRRDGAAPRWDPAAMVCDLGSRPWDAVIHLAGENIVGRWTSDKRRRIHDSRSEGTALLARKLASLAHPPSVFLCASGIDAYGQRGSALCTEDTPIGDGFLAGVVRDWEAAADPARQAGIRVAHMRLAAVLGAGGGMLAQLLPIFRCGFGGRLGSGRQWLSWVALEDVLGVSERLLHDEAMAGVFNVVAPEALSNRAFTATLARVLRRPALAPVPAPILRLIYGRLADEVLLGSCRAEPRRLLEAGFEFRYPDLAELLRIESGLVDWPPPSP